ncbi:hypothetical protein AAF712_005880 [Marasmius tenuissimus]|uniref:Actin-like ATPase domain-containing protein n=1 Tax=Marasmius tenuissimus TaxID=585030 RepID=A0ABR3A0C8_9AGAR
MEGSRYIDYLDHTVELFNDTTKKHFRGPAKDMYIKFCGIREHDEARGVRDGQLRLKGEDVASFFEPSVASVVRSVETILDSIKDVGLPRVFLVGGMAASDYVFNELESRLSPAVKGKRVTEETEIRKDYYIARRDRDDPELNHIDQKILVYEGTEDEPQWIDDGPRSQFRQVATLRADTRHLKRKVASSQGKRRRKRSSSEYWQIDFAIVLLFGGTELKAQLAWQERGREVRSPIEIIYEHNNRLVGR